MVNVYVGQSHWDVARTLGDMSGPEWLRVVPYFSGPVFLQYLTDHALLTFQVKLLLLLEIAAEEGAGEYSEFSELQ